MSDKDREQVVAALLESRGALQMIATTDNLVGNIIARIDLALGKLAAPAR